MSENSRNSNVEVDLRALKRAKGRAQATITRVFTYVESEACDGTKEQLLLGKLEQIKAAFSEFMFLSNKLSDFLSDAELDVMDSVFGEVEDNYYTAVALLEGKLNYRPVLRAESQNSLSKVSSRNSLHGSRTGHSSKSSSDKLSGDTVNVDAGSESEQQKIFKRASNLKLPKLEIPSFDGKIESWLYFHEIFDTMVVKNKEMTNFEKFVYLNTCLKGEAKELVGNIAIKGENFTFAWDSLLRRYENNKLLTESHVANLFRLEKLDNPVSGQNFRDFYNAILKNTNALSKLGVSLEACKVFLLHLCVSKLDLQTLYEWEKKDLNEIPKFEQFEVFLRERCAYLDSVETKVKEVGMVKDNFKGRSTKKKEGSNSFLSKRENSQSSCALCDGAGHAIWKCSRFHNSSVDQRREIIKSKGLCWLCLRSGHLARDCQLQACKRCGGRHNHLLCAKNVTPGGTEGNGASKGETFLKPTAKQVVEAQVHSYNAINRSNEIGHRVLLATASVSLKGSNGKLINGRFILDSGSEINFITDEFAKMLNLNCDGSSVEINGIAGVSSRSKGSVETEMSSRLGGYTKMVRFSILDKITGDNFGMGRVNHWSLPDNISQRLADKDFGNSNKGIDGLLGAGIFFEILGSERYYPEGKKLGTYFLKTKLGWIVAGELKSSVKQNSLKDCFFVEGSPKVSSGQENRLAEELFVSTTEVLKDGRFQVLMPLSLDPNEIGNTYNGAKVRFLNLEKRLNGRPEVKLEYRRFIREYLDLGHMELVPNEDLWKVPSYFLPHHAVFKESSTTSVRVVFDASFSSSNGASLNKIMISGPPLLADMMGLLLAFRTHKYAMTADVEKMFRQIWIAPEQRDLLRIFWRDNPTDDLKVYRLKTVTYGTAAAPFLAIRCLKQIAHDIESAEPKTAAIISENFYMDDLLTGGNSYEEIYQIKERVEFHLKERGMNLRKWCSNSKELMDTVASEEKGVSWTNDDQKVKILGMGWDAEQDEFVFKINTWEKDKITKRNILSFMQGCWDPLGFMFPVLIKGRMFIQDLWILGLDWDEELEPTLSQRWLKYQEKLKGLSNLRVPRKAFDEYDSLELHGFCDASEKAYACVIYARIETSCGVDTRLLCAKAKVAPLQTLTIPRLELLGAVMLAELAVSVKKSLNLENARMHFWTDSTIVLNWINGLPGQFKSYVSNRISEIQSVSSKNDWHYVNTKENPADVASRGTSVKEYMENDLWWQGPEFLHNKLRDWPKFDSWSSDLPEKRKITFSLVSTCMDLDIINNCSRWPRLIRIIAYVVRFINNVKHQIKKQVGFLTVNELREAEVIILKEIQGRDFSEEIKCLNSNRKIPRSSKLDSLSVFLDDQGLLRVGGRLKNTDLTEDAKNPIVIPVGHVSKIILRDLHLKNLHVGPQGLLGICRARYWPIWGASVSKGVVKECVICTRYKPKLMSNIMGDLPKERVTQARPFSVVGVDFCGPFYIREGLRKIIKVKAYVAVFVCFKVKAVHLELVSGLSTAHFMAAFRRFCGRRGRPAVMYSDNGTNFVGAAKELEIDWTEVGGEGALQGIEWRFSPPIGPHFGGLWEAAVKSFKGHFIKTVGSVLLRFEEFCTLLTEIEAVLNSRPLVPLSNSPDDLEILTPSHLFIGNALAIVGKTPSSTRGRWDLIQKAKETFWNRWSTEYLTTLQRRQKWKTGSKNISIGALVLLKDDCLAPFHWKRGRISEVHPGRDGVVRVVTVRVPGGHRLKRPITALAPLLHEEETTDEC